MSYGDQVTPKPAALKARPIFSPKMCVFSPQHEFFLENLSVIKKRGRSGQEDSVAGEANGLARTAAAAELPGIPFWGLRM